METLATIQNRIQVECLKANRKTTPLLIAVSKFQPLEKMIELYHQGQRDFGENYVQELVAKKNAFLERGYSDVRFHFIGKLQSNKVKALLPAVHAIHSVDSLRLLLEIEKRAVELGNAPEIYFQVNIDSEDTKSGFRVSELPNLEAQLPPALHSTPMGMMCIPSPDLNPEAAFQRMNTLSQIHGSRLGSGLSMGMSGDYPLAIAHGSTAIRIGTALFGERVNEEAQFVTDPPWLDRRNRGDA